MPTRNAIATLVLVVVAATGVTAQKDASAKSLYHRLGGYDVISAIVNDLEGRFGEDPELKLFTVLSADTGKRQTQMLVEFLCERTGGPCAYLGRDMKTTHAGLAISEAHWKATMRHLGAALDAAKVPKQERSELMEIFEKLKSDIVLK